MIIIVILAFFVGHFVGWNQQERLVEGYHRIWCIATDPEGST